MSDTVLFLSEQLFAMVLPENEFITIVDLGAAGGCAPEWLAFKDRIIVHGFDPDSNECARLNQYSSSQGLRHHYYPLCIAGKDEERDFYVTKFGGSCSLYRPNEALINRWRQSPFGRPEPSRDYNSLMKITKVKTVTLDQWAAQHAINFPIDFIKLDVQGAEFEILQTAKTILDNCLGIYTEVWFVPVYIDIPMFSDIDSYLRDNNFDFYSFHINLPGQFVGRLSSPVSFDKVETYKDQKLAGQLVTADALYFRDFEKHHKTINEMRLVKQAIIAEVNGQVEYAFEIISFLMNKNDIDHTLRAKLRLAFLAAAKEYNISQHQENRSNMVT